jgi:hypothetical protein
VISGDRHSGDRRLGTLNALFPRGKYFGKLSPIGPSSLVTVTPRHTLSLAEPLAVALAAELARMDTASSFVGVVEDFGWRGDSFLIVAE